MDAKHPVHPCHGKCGEMSKTAECTVCEHNVARPQLVVDTVRERHVGRPQRSNGNSQQHPRAHVKERQEMSHREPAAGTLQWRLTESFLEIRRVGHRTPSAIHHPDAMPEPQAGIRQARLQATADDGEQSLEHLQRQMTAGKGKCPGGHLLAQESGNVAARCVAVQHLKQESMDGRRRRQITLATGVSHRPTDFLDRRHVQRLANILLDLRYGLVENVVHRRPLCVRDVALAMTILTGGLLFLCAIAVLLPACTASIDISMARNDLRANFLPFPASVRASDPAAPSS
jgi:hypothetical protein